MKSFKVDEIVVSKIVKLLDKGEIPWRKPWNVLLHKSLVRNKSYRGVNPWILAASAQEYGFKSPYWISYGDALEFRESECKRLNIEDQSNVEIIKKSEFGNYTPIVYFTIVTKEKKNAYGDTEEYSYPCVKFYKVWNVDQCNITPRMESLISKRTPEKLDFTPIEQAELLIETYEDKPETKPDSARAFYSPSVDYIGMPEKDQFKSVESYYSTYFHELAHSTGHKNRLNRFGKVYTNCFGDHEYSKEELVAEFTAAFCCSATGISNDKLIENSAAYIQSWRKALKDNPAWLREAATKANQAFDYMTGKKYEAEKSA